MTALPTTPVAAAPRPQARQIPRWADLKRIGDAQRLVLLTFLVGLLAMPASAAIGAGFGAFRPDHGDIGVGVIAVLVLVVAVRAWMAVAVYRLARALGSRVGVLWALGAFIPNVLGLVV